MSALTIISTRLGEVDLGLPAQDLVRLGRVTDQKVDLGRAQEALVDDDVLLPVEADGLEGQAAELADLVRLAGRDDVVAGLVLLQHQPHGADVVGGVAPVTLRVEVAERQLLVELVRDARHAVRHLAGDELEAAAGRFVVEEDARRGVQVVALAVVDRDPVAVDLGHAVGAAGVERRRLALGDLDHLAEHLRRAGLVEADLGVDEPDRVEQAGDAQGRGLAGEHRLARSWSARRTGRPGCRPRSAGGRAGC